MARYMLEIDIPAVQRLFALQDKYDRIELELKNYAASQYADEEPQALMKAQASLLRLILACEKPLGIGAANRARMNLKADPAAQAKSAPREPEPARKTGGEVIDL